MNIGITSGSGAKIAVKKTTGDVHYNRLSSTTRMKSIDFTTDTMWTGTFTSTTEKRVYRVTPAETESDLVDRNGGGIRILHARLSSHNGFDFDRATVLIANESVVADPDPLAGFYAADSFVTGIEKVQGLINLRSISSDYLPSGLRLWDLYTTDLFDPVRSSVDGMNIDRGYNQKKRFPFFCKSNSKDLVFHLFFFRQGSGITLAGGNTANLTLFYQQVYK